MSHFLRERLDFVRRAAIDMKRFTDQLGVCIADIVRGKAHHIVSYVFSNKTFAFSQRI